MKKGCLLFDWSGTLADEYEMDKNVCKNIAIALAHKKGISIEKAEKQYVNLLKRLEGSWNWYNYPLHCRILKIDWKKPQLKELHKLKVINNAQSILRHYRNKGFNIFLVTNAVKSVVELRIRYLKMRNFFDAIITSDMVKSKKVSGKHFEQALKLVECPIENTYAIGDNLIQDLLPAKKYGIMTILCDFGNMAYFHTNGFNGKRKYPTFTPDYTIRNLDEIRKIIKFRRINLE